MANISTTLGANDILVEALTDIRVVTEFSPDIPGFYEAKGMLRLNEILQDLNSQSSGLPFYYTFPFTISANKKRYVFGISDEADIRIAYPLDTIFINVFYSGLKYPVEIISDRLALDSIINTSLTFLPAQARVYFEQDAVGATSTIIDFLYAPNQDYAAEIRAKPTLTDLNINDFISLLPRYYHSYLRLELAYRLAPLTGRDDVWTPQLAEQHARAEEQIRSANKVDYSLNVSTALLGNSRWVATRLGVRNAL